MYVRALRNQAISDVHSRGAGQMVAVNATFAIICILPFIFIPFLLAFSLIERRFWHR